MLFCHINVYWANNVLYFMTLIMKKTFLNLFFNWKIIALQNLWFSVRHQQESAIGTPMSPPPETPSHFPLLPTLLDCHRASAVLAPWVIQQIPIGYFTYAIVNFNVTVPIHLTLSLLPSPYVHISVLCVYFSIAVLKINSSVFGFHTYMHQYTILFFLFLTYFTLYNKH